MKKLLHLLALIMILLLTGCGHENDTEPLSSMLDKNIRGIEIQKWLTIVEESPEISRHDDVFFYSFKKKGISLRFDNKTETLTTIFLYSEGANDYRQYQGELPFKLSFVLSRKEIESILGKPEKSGGEGVINYWVYYPSNGIGITYNSKHIDDLNAQIYTLYINKIR
ncbi:MAG: DUF6392 family protein [Desulfomicrobium sp.]|nr:DUF6392 family protein [Desulfomicrobium sp.]